MKKVVRIVGAVAVVTVLAFPPWFDARPGLSAKRSVGRHPVWDRPVNSQVHASRLAVEVGGILGAAFLLTLGRDEDAD